MFKKKKVNSSKEEKSSKFLYNVGVCCSLQEFEKDLKDELEKIGYKKDPEFIHSPDIDGFTNKACCYFLYTNKDRNTYIISSTSCILELDYYVTDYNFKLFLALAAMTDYPRRINYGEYWKQGFTEELHQVYSTYTKLIGWDRKATKEELIKYFTNEKNIMRNTIENINKEIYKNLKEGHLFRLNTNVLCLYSGSNVVYQLTSTIGIISLSTAIPNIQAIYSTSIEEFTSGTPLRTIWERPKEIELTLDEIANKFNVDVKNLRIKK